MEKNILFISGRLLLFLGSYFFVYVLFMLKSILIPLAFAVMISILLNPLVNKLQQKKIPKIISICIALFVAIFFCSRYNGFYFISN